MDIESIRNFALALDDVTESCPFGPEVIVFKVKDKIFLLLPLDTDKVQFNVKCDPDDAIELREKYPESILPGYHMNKKHWNTVILNGQIHDEEVRHFIQNSHQLILRKSSKK